ncbi:MAG TPA: amino acid ABC transporter substrate-binding protein [Oligoflexus sp.]|uniref:amino acid ABC transporter substrate-binding protein n=1 Tax=Oligoflexus sp. TaxID=1971216 RepID=UPI002D7EAD22|nr:amino acid ABC transporter substrate-binding protein [Oligoflexus sp.]HET9238168.1 amino acid ABC transporter substrate-binding protein [Oligoflexus sp.]
MKSFWPSICGLSLLITSSWLQADTLDEVKKRGFLKCGVSQGLAGFSSPDKAGQWRGIDVDLCRGVAAATLGDANKVKYTSLSAKERFTALQSGEIDLLSRNTSWTIVRDTSLAVDFPGVLYYDGQGFMAPKKLNVKTLKDLNGATVCVNLGTTTELNLADYFRSQKMTYKLVAFEKNDEVVAAYDAGRCDVMSSDQSGLYADRTRLKKPEDHVILPEIISKEPLGPAVRHGDNRWGDIVRWTLFAMIEAEELKITSANVDQQKANSNPAVRRLLGMEGDLGKNLGLKADWALQVVKQVGSYQEIFERNLGANTPLKIARGQNALWRDGGLQYSMPFR